MMPFLYTHLRPVGLQVTSQGYKTCVPGKLEKPLIRPHFDFHSGALAIMIGRAVAPGRSP